MRVLGKNLIKEFTAQHPVSSRRMGTWVGVVENADWKHPGDLKDTFRTASFTNSGWVFDVGGNDYRVLTAVSFEFKTVTVKQLGTHTEYDRWKL